ncbi:1288_t:CDS:10 [Paraglomus occultum]|uniref:1288_t:CDS:1 n=1 Tax=Paraglomus occultum TaxID=144539 RepID=A0A9N9CFE2_9GLOM|nr:1288_t:CDS:10 [Paraglomus occultum]
MFIPRQQSSRLPRDTSIISTSSTQDTITSFSRSASEYSSFNSTFFSEIRHEDGKTLPYLKYKNLTVERLPALPFEVKTFLQDTEGQCQGSINSNVGYAAVWSLTDCYVWNYKEEQLQQRMPTCYRFRFSMPIATTFVCIVPPINGATPGLLVCSLKGNLKYWDKISFALTEVERYKSLDLHLDKDDYVTCLDCYEYGNVIIVGTENLNLFSIIVKKGKTSTLESTVLLRNQGFVDLFLSSIFGQTDEPVNFRVVTTTLGEKLEKEYLCELFVLTEKTLEFYQLAPALYPHKFISSSDIHQLIACDIQQSVVNQFDATSSIDLKLLDVEYSSYEELVILVSSMRRNENCQFFLYTIEIDRSENAQYRVRGNRQLKVPNSLSLSAKPRLVLLSGGSSAFVLFPEAVIITALIKDVDYNETITMRDSRRDVILYGCSEREEMLIQDLKAKLEWIVFYHNFEDNPLQPYLSADQETDLNQVALKLGEEILNTSCEHLDDSKSLEYQLNDRLIKITRIVKSISLCKRLNQLTTATLTSLFWNSDKIACAKNLWIYQNAASSDLLEDAIKAYFHDHNINIKAQINEDLSTQFYKYHVRDVGSLFGYVEQQLLARFFDSEYKALFMYQANLILLTGLEGALEYRKSMKQVYCLTETEEAGAEAWSSNPEIATILRKQLESTEALILDISARSNQTKRKGINAVIDKMEQIRILKDQMVDLAANFFVFFGATFNSSKDESEPPSILKSLVAVGEKASALRHAEAYKDFRTLVELSLLDEKETNARTQLYMNKFGQTFAYVFYDCLLEQGKLHELLDWPHAHEHKQFLQQYLNERKPPQISWIHNIYCKDYKTAAENLYQDALAEQQVDKTKLTMLSISKLLILASIESNVDSPEIRNLLKDVESHLDLLNGAAAAHSERLEKLYGTAF